MKNIWLYIIIAVILIAGFIYFNSETSKQNTTKIDNAKTNKHQITASFYPLYFFASVIGKDKTDVFNITPAGVEPHDYDPTPQDIARIQNTKLLIVNGGSFEPWLDKLKDELKNVTIVNTTEGLSLQESTQRHEEEHEEEEDEKHEEESNIDPHTWLSPVLAKSQVDKIYQGFIKIDPNNRASYVANTEDLKQKLDELDRKFAQGLSACSQKSFVTSHTAFSYLAAEYNLTQVPISGITPDEEPSPAQLAQVSEFVKENNIKYIFFETLVSPKLSETIANETGAKTLVLDPIEGLSDDDIRTGKNYFTVMEDNLKNLQIALECSK